jgi:ankyrin repeat protein
MDAPGWQNTVVVNSNNLTTNLALLDSHIVSEADRNPWTNCPRHACRFLFQDGFCDSLCNTPECLWDGNDCLSPQLCSDLAYCRHGLRDGVCDDDCHNRGCFWDAVDCNVPSQTSLSNTFQVFLDIPFDIYVSSHPFTQITLGKLLTTFVHRINASMSSEVGEAPSYGTVVTYYASDLCANRCFPSIASVVSFVNALITANELSRPLRPVGASFPKPPFPVESQSSSLAVPLAAILSFLILTLTAAVVAVVKRKRHRIAHANLKGLEQESSEYSQSSTTDPDQSKEAVRKIFKASSEEDIRGSHPALNEIVFPGDECVNILDDLSWLPPGFPPLEDLHQQDARELCDLLESDHREEDDLQWDELIEPSFMSLSPKDSAESSLLPDFSPPSSEQLSSDRSLHLVVSKSSSSAVETLSDSAEECDESGNTALLRAAFSGNLQELRQSIAKGASLTHVNNAGNSALHLVACQARSAESIHFLASSGCPLNSKNHIGLTPLHQAVVSNSIDALKALIQLHADVNVPDSNRSTPLMTALKLHHDEAAPLLLTPLLLANQADIRGWTALHWASALGISHLIRPLVCCRANPNAASLQGQTPLHLAAREGNLACVEQLLSLGAKRLVADEFGNTPIDFASARGHDDIATLISESQPTPSQAQPAVSSPSSTSNSSSASVSQRSDLKPETLHKQSTRATKSAPRQAKQVGLTMLQQRLQMTKTARAESVSANESPAS